MYLIRVVLFFILSYHVYGYKEIYTGMFREGDVIVAKDSFYRQRVPFKIVYGYYYKKVICPITYIKVRDRLGVSPGPTAEIIRGGLQNDHVVLLIGSAYNKPVYVNIYIGCENMSRENTEENSGVE